MTKEWNSFSSLRAEIRFSSPQIIDLPVEIGWWPTIPTFKVNRLCRFCSSNVVENEARFMLECPLYNSMEEKFTLIFENVVSSNLRSLFQLDHQVDISLCPTEATTLCHYRN